MTVTAVLEGHLKPLTAGGTLPGRVDIRDAPPPPARSAARREPRAPRAARGGAARAAWSGRRGAIYVYIYIYIDR